MLSEAVGTTLILPDMAAVIENDSGQLVDQVRTIVSALEKRRKQIQLETTTSADRN
jgi:hypothetical protein